MTGYNGRAVYEQADTSFHLFFKDWGSNQGENWAVAENYESSSILLSSPNMENVENTCVTDTQQVSRKCPNSQLAGYLALTLLLLDGFWVISDLPTAGSVESEHPLKKSAGRIDPPPPSSSSQ